MAVRHDDPPPTVPSPSESGPQPSRRASFDLALPTTSVSEQTVREILVEYVEASERADMPHTAAITQSLTNGGPQDPLPPAAVRLGQFLLARRGLS